MQYWICIGATIARRISRAPISFPRCWNTIARVSGRAYYVPLAPFYYLIVCTVAQNHHSSRVLIRLTEKLQAMFSEIGVRQ